MQEPTSTSDGGDSFALPRLPDILTAVPWARLHDDLDGVAFAPLAGGLAGVVTFATFFTSRSAAFLQIS